MSSLLPDKSIILSILPLLVAIPVAIGFLIFLSHKLQHPPSKPLSRSTGEHFQKIGRSRAGDIYTDSPADVAQAAHSHVSPEQLPGPDDVDTISGA